MSIRDYKITDAQFSEKGVIAAPDTLTGTAAENKGVFDRFVREIVAPQFNAIVDLFADMEESTNSWSAEEAQRVRQENARQTAEQGRASMEGQRETNETARLSAEENRISAENDRVTAETARMNAENKRDSAEKSRVAAENGRVSAESARVTAESQRANAESSRAQNEAARISAETGRADAEADRVSAEDTRISAETARKTAETGRASAETVRESGEAARKSAETGRVSAETARANAESTRQTSETARVSAETARNVWEAYDAAKTYVPGNKVSFNGSSYVCTAATTGHAPTDTAYWLLIAQKGEDGAGADDLRQINNALDAVDPTKITAKAAPADGDGVMIADSADGGKAKRLLWSSVKEALKQVFSDVRTAVSRHIADKSNPHGVTAEQIGALKSYTQMIAEPETFDAVKALEPGVYGWVSSTRREWMPDGVRSASGAIRFELIIRKSENQNQSYVLRCIDGALNFREYIGEHDYKDGVADSAMRWSEVITNTNIGDQCVLRARYNYDTEVSADPTKFMLRGSALYNTETTPWCGGTVYWQYG